MSDAGASNTQAQQQVQQFQIIQQFWQKQIQDIETGEHDFKNHQLPLARVKKVMKTDEEVKMISAEAPVLFAKACEIFILELTLRAWIHTEENKRRTLQRNDIAMAISRTDIFDFLIDIVPREDTKPMKKLDGDYRQGVLDAPYPYYSLQGALPHPYAVATPEVTRGMDTVMLYQQQQLYARQQHLMQQMQQMHHMSQHQAAQSPAASGQQQLQQQQQQHAGQPQSGFSTPSHFSY